MNHCYRILWSDAAGTYVAVPETASRRGKRTRGVRGTVLAAALAGTLAAHAAPQGGEIRAGQGSIAVQGSTTTVTQGSAKLAVQWQSFGVAEGETVNFVQPGRDAIALNRVVGGQPSEILGRLNANGQVFLLNPNGVLFGRTAQVSVGGLLASTLDLSDDDFLAGRFTLRGSGGVVRNEGQLRAADGGYVALVGGQVHNDGTVVADRGTVALAAGSRATLDFGGDGLLKLSVDQGTLAALVRNGGVVQADGGTALLTAKAADALAGTVVNNTGIVRARTLENRGGVVRLLGGFEGGTVDVGGTLDVSAPAGGDAGFIETSGAQVRMQPDARLDVAARSGAAGRWLIDPNDITVDASMANAIGSVLGFGGSVTTTTAGGTGGNGDIFVNAPVSWTGSGTWVLEADRDIHINAAINAPFGALSLTALNAIDAAGAVYVETFQLNAGDWRQLGPSLPSFRANDFQINGGSFLRVAGGDGSIATPYRITDVYGLQGITSETTGTNSTLARNYVLANDINAADTGGWNGGSGFRPIGAMWDPFTGSFDGGGHVISNLVASGFDGVGLFGAVDTTGSVRNLGVQGGTMSGAGAVGGVVGNNLGTIANVWSSATVTGDYAGGVVGSNGGAVSDSHATGAVSGSQSLGGFVGYNEGSITRSWATGAVDGSAGVGGFAGNNAATGSITVAYATGAVHATNGTTGGFVGYNEGAIANAYAAGAVTVLHVPADPVVTQHTGGFVGRLESGSLTNVYATGRVTNDSVYKGGLGGSKGVMATLSGAYWDKTSTGLNNGFGGISGGTGLTSTQAKTQASYTAFDFTNTWVIYGGQTNPLLRAFLKPLTVTAANAGRTYDGTAWSGGNGVTYSVVPDPSLLFGTLSYGGTAQGSKNAGTYTITTGGLWSTQQGYLITYANGSLTTGRKALTVTGVTAADKVYDATATAALGLGAAALSGVVAGDVVTLSTSGMSGQFADKNVGDAKAVAVNGAALTGAAAGNYTVSNPTGVTASITPASLGLVGITASDKVYDATNAATLNTAGAALSGVRGADVVTLNGAVLTGAFADKNVGQDKPVTVATVGALGGADAGNYVLASPAGVTASITPATLALIGVTAADKVYDATTLATLNLAGAALAGVLGTDAVALDAHAMAGRFADKNVGSGKAVAISGAALGGSDAGNYVLAAPPAASASITPAALGVTGVAAANKVYDGTTAATVTTGGAGLSGVLGGDSVTLDASALSATFADRHVGNGKAVTVTGAAVSGADAGNYVVANPAGLQADITPATLVLAGVTARDKVYDGTTAATLNTGATALSGVIGSDAVTLDARALAGSFSDRNVGNGKAVTLTGATLAGADAGDYVLSPLAASNASITPARLVVVADDQAKAFGAADPALTYLATGFVGGETAGTALDGGLSRRPGEWAGGYDITQGSLAAVGGNYTIAYTAGTLTIAPAPAMGTSGSLQRVAYPTPELPARPDCADRRHAAVEDAGCARPLPLRIVGQGVRMPEAQRP